ncbi:MAG: Uncharacterised protein [Cryomorphaceae bacterium]|nr:MAG: Uncharacterised protein [Cryomorphaceae bacterium]
MRKRLILTIISLSVSFSGLSQELEKSDTYKFIANFDMRNSVIIKQSVKFNGLKFGLGNSKNRFGIGFYGLRESVFTTNFRVDSLNATDTNKYDFGFISFYYERILYQSKRWEFSAPVHINLGSLQGFYLTNNNVYKKFLDKPVSSLTLSVKSHFKVFRWVGLHGGIGYNFILSSDKRTQSALNDPFYSFGVKFFLGEAWKLTFNKNYRKSPWID